MWSRVIPPSCDSSFIRQQVGMMPRMPPPRIERMYRMICVALQLFYHSIRGTRVRLGPYVFSMRQAFPIQAALAQRKSNPVRYSLLSVAAVGRLGTRRALSVRVASSVHDPTQEEIRATFRYRRSSFPSPVYRCVEEAISGVVRRVQAERHRH